MKQMILLAVLGYIGVVLKDLPRNLMYIFSTNMFCSLAVTNDNVEQYNKLNKWLLGLNKKCLNNNTEVISIQKNNVEENFHTINYGVYIFKVEKGVYCYLKKTKQETSSWNFKNMIDLTLFGPKRKHVLNDLRRIMDKPLVSGTRVFTSPSDFDSGKIIPSREFKDIFMKNKDFLIQSLDNWTVNKEIFESKGILHKLGILLHGEPGCGKSSIAKAIADYLGYDLYYINLKGFKEYERLVYKLTSIPEKSVILFEDIDCLIGNRENENDNEKDEILNTALNFIDGVLSPNDCIIVATTNYLERLDAAFTRDGRFDIKIETTKLDLDLATEMCNSYNVDIKDLNIEVPINPSELQNKILKKIGEL